MLALSLKQTQKIAIAEKFDFNFNLIQKHFLRVDIFLIISSYNIMSFINETKLEQTFQYATDSILRQSTDQIIKRIVA